MSLSLVQDYSSEEEIVEEEVPASEDDDLGSGGDDEREEVPAPSDDVHDVGGSGIEWAPDLESESPRAESSLLPSPEDLFSEVTGPPEFLKSSATEPLYTRGNDSWQSSSGHPITRVNRSDPVADHGPEVVIEANAKSSVSRNQVQAASGNGAGAAARENINAPPRLHIGADIKPTTDADKRNRSKIKDKEKNKRMKGQSSHATWKTETEMQLRQQFD